MRNVYWSRAYVYLCVCICVCLSAAAFAHYCTDPDVTWGMVWGCPLVVHYWADLQSVHGFRCNDSIAANAKCWPVIVLAVEYCIYFMLLQTHQKYDDNDDEMM